MFKHVLSDEAGFEACFVSPLFPFWASPQRSALCPLTQPNFTGLRLVLATLMQDERKASCPLAAQATQRYWLWGAGPLTEGAPGLAIAAWLHLAEPPSPNQQSGAGGSRAWRCITPRPASPPPSTCWEARRRQLCKSCLPHRVPRPCAGRVLGATWRALGRGWACAVRAACAPSGGWRFGAEGGLGNLCRSPGSLGGKPKTLLRGHSLTSSSWSLFGEGLATCPRSTVSVGFYA
ncbi:uncharacterized protein LOC110346253 [Heterocephalus glaber]|uniref:Uncharacterized protein LOC110346253 n=1 Tax=Heterocephalus glaber TaxID=10181 RepID=A0AAX6S012_HETGA|nr:uncharacterized protein LOC110346253 [Heterocephalus glaber]